MHFISVTYIDIQNIPTTLYAHSKCIVENSYVYGFINLLLGKVSTLTIVQRYIVFSKMH